MPSLALHTFRILIKVLPNTRDRRVTNIPVLISLYFVQELQLHRYRLSHGNATVCLQGNRYENASTMVPVSKIVNYLSSSLVAEVLL